MSRGDDKNPSDFEGAFSTGSNIIGFVVDLKDPLELGRVKVRKFDQDKGRVPDDKLPWVHCSYNNQPSLRGTGTGPPNLSVGSRVMMTSLGQQGYVVTNSIPNTEQEKSKSDVPEPTKSATPVPLWRDGDGKDNHEKLINLVSKVGSEDALNILNGKEITDWATKEANQYYNTPINDSVVPDHYNKRAKSRNVDKKTVGVEQFAGEITNAQKYIKNKIGNVGSVLPGALDMIDNLYKVKDPLSVPDPTQTVGAQNIASALQGILDFFKENKDNDKQEIDCNLIVDPLEKAACLLLKEAERIIEEELNIRINNLVS